MTYSAPRHILSNPSSLSKSAPLALYCKLDALFEVATPSVSIGFEPRPNAVTSKYLLNLVSFMRTNPAPTPITQTQTASRELRRLFRTLSKPYFANAIRFSATPMAFNGADSYFRRPSMGSVSQRSVQLVVSYTPRTFTGSFEDSVSLSDAFQPPSGAKYRFPLG